MYLFTLCISEQRGIFSSIGTTVERRNPPTEAGVLTSGGTEQEGEGRSRGTCEHDEDYLVTHGFRLYDDHCRQVAALYSDHYRQVAALYSDHYTQVTALYSDHYRQVAALYSDHCRQVAALYSDHCRQVAALYSDTPLSYYGHK